MGEGLYVLASGSVTQFEYVITCAKCRSSRRRKLGAADVLLTHRVVQCGFAILSAESRRSLLPSTSDDPGRGSFGGNRYSGRGARPSSRRP